MGNGTVKAHVARSAPNKVGENPFIPVVVVPGILASRLYSPAFKNGVWDPDSIPHMLKDHLLASSEHQRRLFSTQGARVMSAHKKYTANQELRGWGEMVASVYESFLKACDGHKFRSFESKTYAVGYNFLESNQIACDRLTSRVQDILDQEAGKHGVKPKGFLLVTHSMGCLLVRSALKKSKVLEANCLGVVYVVPPNHGAVLFYRRFFTGATHDEFLVNVIFGNTKTKFATAASAIGSAFELLPTNDYAASGQKPREWLQWETRAQPPENLAYLDPKWRVSPPATDIFSAYAEEGVPCITSYLPELDAKLREAILRRTRKAREYHQWLGSYVKEPFAIVSSKDVTTDTAARAICSVDVKREPGTTSIQGSTTSTVPPTTRISNMRITGQEVRTKDGDGTVPLASQEAFSDRAMSVTRFTGIQHGPALTDPSLQTYVFEILDELVSGSVKSSDEPMPRSPGTKAGRTVERFFRNRSPLPV